MTARAGAGTSLVSYLTQEAECARLVREAGLPALEEVYADLVWDRDGFVAVNRYLLAWEAPSEADDEVAAAVHALLEAVPAPDAIGPLRRATLELAARGEFDAGHAIARVAGGHPEGTDSTEERADLVATWRALLAADSAWSDEERALVLERLSRQLAQPRAAGSEWRQLVEQARDMLGERARLFAVDAWQEPSDDDARREMRARIGARVDRVSGGDLLVIEGTVSADAASVADDPRPALFDGEAALAAGEGRVIDAANVTWRTAADGVRSWSAAFPAASLPLHRPLTPVVVAGDTITNIDAAFELPPYSRRDAFLYDVVDRILVVRRRRHWLVRGIRRLLP